MSTESRWCNKGSPLKIHVKSNHFHDLHFYQPSLNHQSIWLVVCPHCQTSLPLSITLHLENLFCIQQPGCYFEIVIQVMLPLSTKSNGLSSIIIPFIIWPLTPSDPPPYWVSFWPPCSLSLFKGYLSLCLSVTIPSPPPSMSFCCCSFLPEIFFFTSFRNCSLKVLRSQNSILLP